MKTASKTECSKQYIASVPQLSQSYLALAKFVCSLKDSFRTNFEMIYVVYVDLTYFQDFFTRKSD